MRLLREVIWATKNPSYWFFNRDLCNGLLQCLHNWVVFHPVKALNNRIKGWNPVPSWRIIIPMSHSQPSQEPMANNRHMAYMYTNEYDGQQVKKMSRPYSTTCLEKLMDPLNAGRMLKEQKGLNNWIARIFFWLNPVQQNHQWRRWLDHSNP